MLKNIFFMNLVFCLPIYSMEFGSVEHVQKLVDGKSDPQVMSELNNDCEALKSKCLALEKGQSIVNMNLQLSAHYMRLKQKIDRLRKSGKITLLDAVDLKSKCDQLFNSIIEKNFQNTNTNHAIVPKAVTYKTESQIESNYGRILLEYGIGMAAVSIVLEVFGVPSHKQKAVDEKE